MIATHRVDQLCVDAHAPRSASCATLQQVAHAKVLCDPAHVDRLSFVGKGSVACDDEQAGDPGQVGDQVFGQTPSAKDSCSGSLLTLTKGSTAIDGLLGSGKGFRIAPPSCSMARSANCGPKHPSNHCRIPGI